MNTYRVLVEKMFKVKVMEELEVQQTEIIAVEEYDSNSIVITYKTSEQAQTFIVRNLPECKFAYVEETDDCGEMGIVDTLNSIVENTYEGTLKHDIAETILNQVDELDNEEILEHVAQIINYGCVSGIVSSLITYKDTDEFFDNHSDEILELLDNDKEEGILDINKVEFNKNWLSWYAFERITFDIQYELKAAYELM